MFVICRHMQFISGSYTRFVFVFFLMRCLAFICRIALFICAAIAGLLADGADVIFYSRHYHSLHPTVLFVQLGWPLAVYYAGSCFFSSLSAAHTFINVKRVAKRAIQLKKLSMFHTSRREQTVRCVTLPTETRRKTLLVCQHYKKLLSLLYTYLYLALFPWSLICQTRYASGRPKDKWVWISRNII